MLHMTTPHERTRAVIETRAFLEELQDTSMHAELPEAIRLEARRLLRHYPSNSDMRLVGLILPLHFSEPVRGTCSSKAG